MDAAARLVEAAKVYREWTKGEYHDNPRISKEFDEALAAVEPLSDELQRRIAEYGGIAEVVRKAEELCLYAGHLTFEKSQREQSQQGGLRSDAPKWMQEDMSKLETQLEKLGRYFSPLIPTWKNPDTDIADEIIATDKVLRDRLQAHTPAPAPSEKCVCGCNYPDHWQQQPAPAVAQEPQGDEWEPPPDTSPIRTVGIPKEAATPREAAGEEE